MLAWEITASNWWSWFVMLTIVLASSLFSWIRGISHPTSLWCSVELSRLPAPDWSAGSRTYWKWRPSCQHSTRLDCILKPLLLFSHPPAGRSTCSLRNYCRTSWNYHRRCYWWSFHLGNPTVVCQEKRETMRTRGSEKERPISLVLLTFRRL